MIIYDEAIITYDQLDKSYDGFDWFADILKPLSYISSLAIVSSIKKTSFNNNSISQSISSNVKNITIKAGIIKDRIISNFK